METYRLAKLKILKECLENYFRDISPLDRRRCVYGRNLKCGDILGGYSAILNLHEISYTGRGSKFLEKHSNLKTFTDVDSYNMKFMFLETSNLYGNKEPELPHASLLPIIADFNFSLNRRCSLWTHYYVDRILGELCLAANSIDIFYTEHSFSFNDDPRKVICAYIEDLFIPYVYNFLLFWMTGEMIYPEYESHRYPDLSKYYNYKEELHEG